MPFCYVSKVCGLDSFFCETEAVDGICLSNSFHSRPPARQKLDAFQALLQGLQLQDTFLGDFAAAVIL